MFFLVVVLFVFAGRLRVGGKDLGWRVVGNPTEEARKSFH